MKLLTVFTIMVSISFTLAGPVSSLFQLPATNDWTKSRSQQEINSTDHNVTEVGIERGACFGNCPVYAFICKSDGTFRYEGVGNVERKGNFSGKIPPEDFNRLAQFIRDSGYLGLEAAYHGWRTDEATVWTMVVASGKRKVVSNTQNAGPTKLWAVEQLIDGLLAKAQWDTFPKTKGEEK